MNIEEAIKTAIEYETKVRDLYQNAVDELKDEHGREIFRRLAEEEQSHVDYLHQKLNQWRTTGTVTAERLKTIVPPKALIQREVSKMAGEMAEIDPDNDLQMLKKALKLEIETSAFYKTMVNTLPHDHQDLFARFIAIEDGHVSLVQAEIDSLTQTGYWFDFLEIDLND
ncbi:MAG: ferritin family protein [Acidobacteria bacterium]|nr:ferritin family protein [Acidobacteriota bacterium]